MIDMLVLSWSGLAVFDGRHGSEIGAAVLHGCGRGLDGGDAS